MRTNPYWIPVRVFPGVFPSEFRVEIRAAGQSLNLLVDKGFVSVEGTPGPDGLPGRLMVDVLEKRRDQVLLALPGEPLGALGRLTVSTDVLQVA